MGNTQYSALPVVLPDFFTVKHYYDTKTIDVLHYPLYDSVRVATADGPRLGFYKYQNEGSMKWQFADRAANVATAPGVFRDFMLRCFFYFPVAEVTAEAREEMRKLGIIVGDSGNSDKTLIRLSVMTDARWDRIRDNSVEMLKPIIPKPFQNGFGKKPF